MTRPSATEQQAITKAWKAKTAAAKPAALCDLYYRGKLEACNMTYATANAKIKKLSATGSYQKRLFDKKKKV